MDGLPQEHGEGNEPVAGNVIDSIRYLGMLRDVECACATGSPILLFILIASLVF